MMGKRKQTRKPGREVKIALIGAGNMANIAHYPALVQFDDVDIVGLCDLVPKKLRATAKKFRIKNTFSDYRRMLDKTKPDAVYALMPPHQLFDVAMDVLERGHHLFIEKPPGLTTIQAESLARAAADNKLVTGVGFQRRYHPLVRACWERVKKKGAVSQVIASFYKLMPVSAVHPYYRGAIDILRSDVIHAVDSLRYYAGLAEVKAVASDVRTLDCWYDVSFNALVRFENGSTGVLLSNWRTGRRIFRYEFHSAGAMAFADIDGEGIVWEDNNLEPAFRSTAAELTGSDDGVIHQGFYGENRAFIDGAKSGRQLHNSLQDSVKTMRLVDEIYENAIG